MLRVRELRPFGQVAKYSNVDLGRDQGSGRGDTACSFFRPKQEYYECFTFLPDTIHNRIVMLHNPKVELAEWKGGVWVSVPPSAAEEYLGPATGTVPPPGKPVAAKVHSLQASDGRVVVNDLEGFLGIPEKAQVELLKSGRIMGEALAEILSSEDSRISKKVRDAAIAAAEKIEVLQK